MAGKISIYLDTSVINFLFADDAPEKKEITKDFFENSIRLGLYDVYISDFVVQELDKTPDEQKRKRLMGIIDEFSLKFIDLSSIDEITQLAKLYLVQNILPSKSLFDALHIACSVIHKIDYLVSWNYKHLANVNRERKVHALNWENNYLHPLRIITPIELYGSENI